MDTEENCRELPRGAWLGGMYSLLSMTGLSSILFPSSLVMHYTGWGVYLWGSFLLIGGAAALWGTITDKWFGEYVGLIPLIFGTMIYSIIVFASSPGSLSRLALGFFLSAMSAGMISRFREMSFIRKVATNTARHNLEED